ncbi:MAG TPA: histidine phosphatase family protein [Candidatus Saccharimonadales bacterium]|nr:histidine phosphatase family protein [Candidatus Saccharimonadales bacterium]
MQVIFARHGQTIFNKEEKFQGYADSPLTQQGISEVFALAEFIKPLYVKKVLVSPLPRVFRSYVLLSEKISIDHEVRQEIKEICYGSWEGKSKKDLQSSKLWHLREKDKFNFKHPGSFNKIHGESYANLYARLQPFFLQLKKTSYPILVLSHLGVMRCAIKYFNALSDSAAGELSIPNNAVIIASNKTSANIKAEIKTL